MYVIMYDAQSLGYATNIAQTFSVLYSNPENELAIAQEELEEPKTISEYFKTRELTDCLVWM